MVETSCGQFSRYLIPLMKRLLPKMQKPSYTYLISENELGDLREHQNAELSMPDLGYLLRARAEEDYDLFCFDDSGNLVPRVDSFFYEPSDCEGPDYWHFDGLGHAIMDSRRVLLGEF
jgi:hypothetical protein